MEQVEIEQFPALEELMFLRHSFIGRVPGLDLNVDREEALARLASTHDEAMTKLGMQKSGRVFAEQVHGPEVAVVAEARPGPVPGVDGLMTATPGLTLGIYVADCCALYLVDPIHRAIALVHCGKKGTEMGITTRAIQRMREVWGSDPSEMIAQLSPCIRPPHYETDFAAEIVRQCKAAGIAQVVDCGICTASDPRRYYSYRREHGKTGRMLALMTLAK